MKKSSTFLIAIFIASSLVSPSNANADVDPIQTSLAAKLPALPLPPNHSRLTRAREQIGADWTISQGYTGQGVSVAVLDEGTQFMHKQLKGRIIEEVCTSVPGNLEPRLSCPNKKSIEVGIGSAEYTKKADGTPYQWADHGTMVSSGVLEFAPDVRIISIKSHGDHIAALKWVIANAKKYNIAAINMSFGGDTNERTYSKCSDDPGFTDWTNAFKALRSLGVASIAASGNGGRTNSISHPACQETVVSVGAVTPEDKVISYSNVSNKLTLLAPTEFESATVPQDQKVDDAWVTSFGGTSAATPVIAALFAVGKSISPNASVDELVDVARSTSTSIDDAIVKDLRRVNFDKFVQKLLGLKLLGDVKSISILKLEGTKATIAWTSNTKPENFRISVEGREPQIVAANVTDIVIEKPTNSSRVKVKVEAIGKDGIANSFKEIEVLFPIIEGASWCNPSGKSLEIMAPLFGYFTVLGPNRLNPNHVDFGISLANGGLPHLDCTFVEMSPLDNPNYAYITRLISGNSTDRHTVVIPKNFGSGGTIRIVYIDRNGNYSKPLVHIFPENSFNLSGVDKYEADLSRINSEIQPELTGVLQKSLLVDQKVVEVVAKEVAEVAQTAALAKAKAEAETAQTAALAKAKAEAETAQTAALAKAKAEAETAQVSALAKAKAEAETAQVSALAKAKSDTEVLLTAQTQVIASIQAQIDSLKKLITKKTTIVCTKGKLTRSVSGVIPECPVGYKLRK